MIRALVPLALFANGIAAGVMLGNAIGLGALVPRLSYGRYVDLIKFMWPRYDPILPILNVLAFGLDIAIVVAVHGEPGGSGAVGLFGLSAALLAVLMVISVTKNVPMNKYVTALDPANPPDDWPERDPRASWTKWNQVRVALSLAALIGSLAGAAVLL
ncbi:MAG: anthrone oxygenase family protein [Pseudonocardiaceae bacterium]